MTTHQQETRFKAVDWQIAQKHAKSISVGKTGNQNHDFDDSQTHCQCCGNIIEKELISLCQNTKQLEFIGIGFPLYFIFFKYVIILLFMQTISVGISSFSSAIQYNYQFCINDVAKHARLLTQSQIHCTSYFVYFACIQETLTNDMKITRIIYFLLTFLYLVYMRDTLIKINGYYDQRSTSYSDYAFILKNLPQKIKIKSDLELLLKNYQVCKMVVIGSFDHIEQSGQRLKHLYQQKKSIIKQQEILRESSKHYLEDSQTKQLQLLEIEISKQQKKFVQVITNEQKLYETDEIIPQKVIVCVETDEQKEEIIKQIKYHGELFKPPQYWTDQDYKKMKIDQSPQPKQIIWSNLNLSTSIKIKYYIFGWIITFTILAIISIIFYFSIMKLTQMIESSAESDRTTAKFAFFIMLVSIIFINKFLLCPLIHYVCHLEHYFTKSKEQYGFTVKYLLSMFFTTALMTILIDAITKENIYHNQFGVVQGESDMIIFTSFLIPLIWLINPWTIWIRVKQMWLRGRKDVSQEEANEAMEAMPYQMGKRYAEVVKLVWLVSLYQSLLPLGTLLAALGLIFYYWVDKYNLLRRSAIKEAVSGFLTLRVMTLLEFSLVLKCSGQLLFDRLIRHEYSISTIICLLVAVVYIFLPKDRILNFFHDEKFNHQQKRFSQCHDQLGVSYQALHPVTGKIMMSLVQSFNSKDKNHLKQDSNTGKIFNPLASILNQSKVMESETINKSLKLWKRQFLTTNRIIQQNLLEKSNIDL